MVALQKVKLRTVIWLRDSTSRHLPPKLKADTNRHFVLMFTETLFPIVKDEKNTNACL